MGQKYGDSGAHAFSAGDMGQVNAAFSRTGEGDLSHFVASNMGDESDPGAKDGEIVGKDGGGAS